jgi:hypothetical protein
VKTGDLNRIARQKAIAAIEEHFATLRLGQSSHQEHVYTEDEVRSYSQRYDIPYPGPYISPEGELLVPPGMLFLRPAATFGITAPDAPPQARLGIYTQAHRQYFKPARVGHKVLFDGEIIDIYEQRGFYYLAVRWQAHEEDGTVLAKGEEWHTLGFVRKEA